MFWGGRGGGRKRKSSLWLFHDIFSPETPVQVDIFSSDNIVALPLLSFLRLPGRKQNHLHYLEAKGLWSSLCSIQLEVRACKCTCNTLLMSFSKGALVTSTQVTNISQIQMMKDVFSYKVFFTCRNWNGISPTSVFLIHSVPFFFFFFSSDSIWSHKHDVLYPDA